MISAGNATSAHAQDFLVNDDLLLLILKTLENATLILRY
jgi:hypothetical protein